MESRLASRGYNVQFWRNEQEILDLAQANQLNHNTESLGHLLRGFFEYYAQIGNMSLTQTKGFDWGRDVLSLRSPGGLLTKQIKGWTGAKTVFEPQGSGAIAPPSVQTISLPAGLPAPNTAENAKQAPPANKTGEVKEVRHRYLFAIEDPFEVDHNVARTVTHNGIVSIRDEFRRAWRIIKTAGNSSFQEDLLRDVSDEEELAGPFLRLLDDIHGIESARSKQPNVSG
jgi:terminal uridylyltransferase